MNLIYRHELGNQVKEKQGKNLSYPQAKIKLTDR
jgi:hypothetical protein